MMSLHRLSRVARPISVVATASKTTSRQLRTAPRRRPLPLAEVRLARQLRDQQVQLRALEDTLSKVHAGIERNGRLSAGLETIIRGIWPEGATQALQRGISVVQDTLPWVRTLVNAPRYVLGGVSALLGIGYVTRSTIYSRVADESAALGKQVLERNVDNLTTTLKAVAKNEETLDALVELLKQLLDAQTTRAALIELLIAVFQDETLVHKTGVFALEALDTPDARAMLDTQLARLASAAVLDEHVQRDAGVGVRKAIKRVFW